MTIGENIKRIRKEKGMTQKELGQKCGIADSAIRRYELGGANPKIETIQKIAYGLNVPWKLLLTNTSPAEKDSLIKNGIKEMVDNFNFEATELKSNTIETSIEVIEQRHKYIKLYDSLNGVGQAKAIERVEELAEIPRYTKEGKPVIYVNTAHANKHTDAPEKLKQQKENNMEDENF